jgi:hypothetical protein
MTLMPMQTNRRRREDETRGGIQEEKGVGLQHEGVGQEMNEAAAPLPSLLQFLPVNGSGPRGPIIYVHTVH